MEVKSHNWPAHTEVKFSIIQCHVSILLHHCQCPVQDAWGGKKQTPIQIELFMSAKTPPTILWNRDYITALPTQRRLWRPVALDGTFHFSVFWIHPCRQRQTDACWGDCSQDLLIALYRAIHDKRRNACYNTIKREVHHGCADPVAVFPGNCIRWNTFEMEWDRTERNKMKRNYTERRGGAGTGKRCDRYELMLRSTVYS